MMIVQYALMVVVTVLFSVLSITTEKRALRVILSLVSFMFWLALGGLNLGLSAVGSVTQVSLTILYFGLGVVWLVLSVYYAFDLWEFTLQQRRRIDTL